MRWILPPPVLRRGPLRCSVADTIARLARQCAARIGPRLNAGRLERLAKVAFYDMDFQLRPPSIDERAQNTRINIFYNLARAFAL